MKDYLVVNLQVKPVEEGRDMLIALMESIGYDSFEETPVGLKAYIIVEDFDKVALEDLPLFSNPTFSINYETEKLDTINWNKEWERNYEPVSLNKDLYIRAPFHEAQGDYRFEIVIEPKMSFGTGHHFTTRLMSQSMFNLDFPGKDVLDMGTGTGILAILAEKLGANKVLAIDNFEWAVDNTAENAGRNACQKVEALHGDAAALSGRDFNIILANINRNILLEDMKVYVASMRPGADLLLSGFFDYDFSLIDAEAQAQGLSFLGKIEENRWQCCHYKKS
jgi:ribosomal protein L11 methyltransferase